MWLACPRTKARLNALQSEVLAREGVHAVRGGVRDAATLFDENAADAWARQGRVAAAAPALAAGWGQGLLWQTAGQADYTYGELSAECGSMR